MSMKGEELNKAEEYAVADGGLVSTPNDRYEMIPYTLRHTYDYSMPYVPHSYRDYYTSCMKGKKIKRNYKR